MTQKTMKLTPAQVAAFERDGFLVVPSVLDDNALGAIVAAMEQRVDDLLARYKQRAHENGGDAPPAAMAPAAENFSDKLTRLLQDTPQAYEHIDISLPMLHDMRARLSDWQSLFGEQWYEQAGVYTDQTIFELVTNANIVSLTRQLLGDEVKASPVQHVRIKPPQRLLRGSAAIDANTARTLWHQDEAVVNEEARGADILTVWVAITDATLENGCMQALAGSHKVADDAALPDFGLTAHCPGKGDSVGEIYIPEEAVDRNACTPLIARAGDVVLLHKRVVHGAGANTSDSIRWSFDMRYQPTDMPSGRDCFPSVVVASRQNPQRVMQNAAQYRASWLRARDAILSGEVTPVFNSRWNKYAPICA